MSKGNLTFPSSARMRLHPFVLLLALLPPWPGATAQSADAVRRAAPSVTLRVRPATGDVFHVRLEQTMEVSSVRRAPAPLPPLGGRATVPAHEGETGPRRDRSPGRLTVMSVHGRSTVESSDASGAVLLATLDSVRVQAGESGRALTSQLVPLAAARTSRLRVAPNGAMSMLEGGVGASAVAPTLSAMPAMLPDDVVQVGDTWEHEVSMPPLPFTTYRTDGVLHTVFRLDSVNRRTGDAWVSVNGTMRRDGPTRDLPAGSRVVTAGTLQGTLHFDRARAWITDATTTVFLQSEIVNAGDGSLPTHVEIRLTQRMRVR